LLPLLVALPMQKYRVAFPVVYLRMVSQRFCELGAFMRCPDCSHTQTPVKQWKPPKAASPHWLSDPGGWKYTEKVERERVNRFEGVIPTRETCNLDDPREMFAWMFAGLPLMNGAPMLFDSGWALDASEHLHDGGAMLTCPECGFSKTPAKEYVPPNLTGSKWLTNPGEWVPYGEKPAQSLDEEIDAALAKMSARQQAELFKALEADEVGEPIPSTPAGDVVARMPAPQKAAIVKRMRERDSA
jgi:hypothetical protein